jgi:hypothetical protein
MSDVHPEQASPAHAEAAFGFLWNLGFRLEDRLVTGGNTFRDGWQLQYAGADVRVTVQYFDAQFEVFFQRAAVVADYLFIDRELFGWRSGLHGNMFAPQKLAPIVDRIADDIRDHFGPILAGDEAAWGRIKKMLDAPKEKRRLP